MTSMQLRARSLQDAAAQSAHLASFWVKNARAKVKDAVEVARAYAAPRLARVHATLRAFASNTNTTARPFFSFVAETLAPVRARTRAIGAQLRRELAEVSAYVSPKMRAFRYAAAPYLVGAALAAGGLTIAAPGVLLAGAGLSVLSYRPLAPATDSRPPVEVLPPGVTFIERFHAINEERWQISDGWDNGYWNWSDWRASALHTSGDGLSIIMGPNPAGSSKPFAGGELQSQGHYRYGYYEVRMRVPRGDGLVVGFFTYTMPDGKPSQQEIDIEFVGSRSNMIEFGYHLGRHSEAQRVHLPFDATEDFHTYAFEWTPEGVRWFVDNRLAHVYANDRTRALNAPERLYLSLSASRIAAWTGELDRSGAPWRLDVTCVAQAAEYRGQSLCAPR